MCFFSARSQNVNKGQSGRDFIDSLVKTGYVRDTVPRKHEVVFSREVAIKFLQKSLQSVFWKNVHDPFRTALGQLVFESSHQPYDSAEIYLKSYPFDSINIPQSLRTKDTTIMIAVDTIRKVNSMSGRFLFRYYRYPYQSDSLKAAVSVLLDYLHSRDSSQVYITGTSGKKVFLWLNSKSDIMKRYWLKNDLDDSLTVWVGTPSRNTIGLYLESGVEFGRPALRAKSQEQGLKLRSRTGPNSWAFIKFLQRPYTGNTTLKLQRLLARDTCQTG